MGPIKLCDRILELNSEDDLMVARNKLLYTLVKRILALFVPVRVEWGVFREPVHFA